MDPGRARLARPGGASDCVSLANADLEHARRTDSGKTSSVDAAPASRSRAANPVQLVPLGELEEAVDPEVALRMVRTYVVRSFACLLVALLALFLGVSLRHKAAVASALWMGAG